MNLKDKIQEETKEALKVKNEKKVTALRFLMAQVKDEEIANQRRELSDEEIEKLISKQIKNLKESLELFEKGKRKDLIEKTKAEVKILQGYLPEQLSNKDLEREIEKIITQHSSVPHPGAMIGICVKALGSRADSKKIAQVVMKKIKG